MRKQSGIDALIATSATSGARRLFDRATALLTAQRRCIPVAAMRHAAARKEVCAAWLGPRLGSRYLFCIHMAKKPTATDEGSLPLIVLREQVSHAIAGSCSCVTAELRSPAAESIWWLPAG